MPRKTGSLSREGREADPPIVSCTAMGHAFLCCEPGATATLDDGKAPPARLVPRFNHRRSRHVPRSRSPVRTRTGAPDGAPALWLRLADRSGVLQTAIGPQRIEAALKTNVGVHANIAFERFAVVTDQLDDLVGPVLGQSDRGTEVAFNAEQTLDGRIVRAEHLIDIGLGHAQFLSLEQREIDPAIDLEPLVIALANHRAKGF